MLPVFVGLSGIFTVQFPYLETSKIFKECRQDGVGIHLVRLHKVAATVCAETLITYFTVVVPGPGLSLHLMNKHSDPCFHLLSHSPSLSVSGFSCTIMFFDIWNSSRLFPSILSQCFQCVYSVLGSCPLLHAALSL